jgi:hypothetical protein
MHHMKYLLYSLLAGLVITAVWSCADDELDPVIAPGAKPAITAPTAGSTLVLVEAEAANPVPDFTWTAPEWGFQAATTYTLQLDLAGGDFSEPATIGIVNGLALSGLTQGELNNILLAKGFEGGNQYNVLLRVVAEVSDDVDPLISETVAMTVTPYLSTVVYPQLQVPGSYQGWDPSNNSTVIFSVKSDNKYEGYLYFNADNTEFKYTNGPSWDVNYGDDGEDGTLDANGANIKAPLAGVYKLNVDLVGLTHANLRTDWGLIGSATPNGWDADQNMTFDPATGKFSITLDLVAGEIKFRANDDWALNYGDDGANKSLEANGANIAIAEAGNYTVELILVGVSRYTYTVTKN